MGFKDFLRPSKNKVLVAVACLLLYLMANPSRINSIVGYIVILYFVACLFVWSLETLTVAIKRLRTNVCRTNRLPRSAGILIAGISIAIGITFLNQFFLPYMTGKFANLMHMVTGILLVFMGVNYMTNSFSKPRKQNALFGLLGVWILTLVISILLYNYLGQTIQYYILVVAITAVLLYSILKRG